MTDEPAKKPDIQAVVSACNDGSYGWTVSERFWEDQPWSSVDRGSALTLTRAFIDAQKSMEQRQAKAR